MRARFRSGIVAATRAQALHLKESDPVQEFLMLLPALFSSGRAHAESTNGTTPVQEKLWGWRTEPAGGVDLYRAQGRLIGWVSGDELWLDPEATYSELQRLARDQSSPFPLSKSTLWKRLDEHGYLTRDGTHLRPKRSTPRGRKRVLVLRATYVTESGASGASDEDGVLDGLQGRPTQTGKAEAENIGSGATENEPVEVGHERNLLDAQEVTEAPLAPIPEGQLLLDDREQLRTRPDADDRLISPTVVSALAADARSGELDRTAGWRHGGDRVSAMGPYIRRLDESKQLVSHAKQIFQRNPHLAARYS